MVVCPEILGKKMRYLLMQYQRLSQYTWILPVSWYEEVAGEGLGVRPVGV